MVNSVKSCGFTASNKQLSLDTTCAPSIGINQSFNLLSNKGTKKTSYKSVYSGPKDNERTA